MPLDNYCPTCGQELPRLQYGPLGTMYRDAPTTRTRRKAPARKKARKLTAWNRYVKNKKNHIKMRGGKLNLKKMAVQFRKKKR